MGRMDEAYARAIDELEDSEFERPLTYEITDAWHWAKFGFGIRVGPKMSATLDHLGEDAMVHELVRCWRGWRDAGRPLPKAPPTCGAVFAAKYSNAPRTCNLLRGHQGLHYSEPGD